nr:hypothetical protein BaRGS_033099 [Batillaria attramentaria]
MLSYVHIEDQLQNVEVLEGERAKFICKVKTHPLDEQRLRVQWKHNGEFLDLGRPGSETGQHVYKSERNRHALIVKNTRLKDTGVYTCIATVGLDTDMSSAHLLVKGPPGPPENVEVVSCHGNTAELRWERGPENGAMITRYVIQFNTSDTPARWHDYFEQFPTTARRALGSLAWESATVDDPLQTQFQQEVKDVYGLYEVQVKAENDLGESHQPALSTSGDRERRLRYWKSVEDDTSKRGSNGWRTMDYIWNKSWVVLDKFDPISDYEVRLLARNRQGDMSTSSILKFSNQRHGGSYYYRLDGRGGNQINGAVRGQPAWWGLGVQISLHLLLMVALAAALDVSA